MHLNIDKLTEDELPALNQRVLARLRLLEQHDTLNSMVKFEVGQQVSFSQQWIIRSGILIKFNPKTVVVRTLEGMRWIVPPQLLSHMVENDLSGNVTPLRRVE